jgi:iron complex outermembrane receptor protein
MQTWAANLNWRRKVGVHQYWSVQLSRTSRFPTPFELSANGIHHGTFRHEQGNPDLDTEHGYQLDISADFRSSNFIFSTAVFANYFHQFIYLRPSARFSTLPEAGQLFNYNQNNAFFNGFELDWNWNFHKNFSWHQTAEYVWNLNLDSNLPLPFTPPASISNEISYHLKDLTKAISGFKTSFYYKYGFAQNRVDRNELKTPDFHFLSAEIMLSTLLNGNELDISFQAQNLLNAQYFNHLSRYRLLNIPEQGINFVIQLKYRLVKSLK